MNEVLSTLLLADSNWETLEIHSKSEAVKKRIHLPRKSGLYQIISNIPDSELVKPFLRNDPKHVIFKDRVAKAEALPKGLLPMRDKDGFRPIYIGENSVLRRRFKSHFLGSKGTGCLNLTEHPTFESYRWLFKYLTIECFVAKLEERTAKKPNIGKSDKLLRTILEQRLRAAKGWPVLCST